MSSITTRYIKYIIDNLQDLNKLIDDLEIGEDEQLKETTGELAPTLSKMIDRIEELGIDYSKLHDESYIMGKKRELKINKITNLL